MLFYLYAFFVSSIINFVWDREEKTLIAFNEITD